MFKAAFIVAFTIFVTVQLLIILVPCFLSGGACYEMPYWLEVVFYLIVLVLTDAIIFKTVVRPLKRTWLFYISIVIAMTPIILLSLAGF